MSSLVLWLTGIRRLCHVVYVCILLISNENSLNFFSFCCIFHILQNLNRIEYNTSDSSLWWVWNLSFSSFAYFMYRFCLSVCCVLFMEIMFVQIHFICRCWLSLFRRDCASSFASTCCFKNLFGTVYTNLILFSLNLAFAYFLQSTWKLFQCTCTCNMESVFQGLISLSNAF